MVKLKGRVELAAGREPEEGGTYKITKVEEVKTAVRGFEGLRVSMTDVKSGEEYATMLWMREVAGQNSKLGAFIAAFTEFFDDEDMALDTDNWVGHVVRFISWAPRNREIRVIE